MNILEQGIMWQITLKQRQGFSVSGTPQPIDQQITPPPIVFHNSFDNILFRQLASQESTGLLRFLIYQNLPA